MIIFFYIYVVLVTVCLLNMLIAMMGDTYEQYKSIAGVVWQRQRIMITMSLEKELDCETADSKNEDEQGDDASKEDESFLFSFLFSRKKFRYYDNHAFDNVRCHCRLPCHCHCCLRCHGRLSNFCIWMPSILLYFAEIKTHQRSPLSVARWFAMSTTLSLEASHVS
eukprot:SAG11_NODE_338_length_10535_cov_8.199885_5_plen_166_part_00